MQTGSSAHWPAYYDLKAFKLPFVAVDGLAGQAAAVMG